MRKEKNDAMASLSQALKEKSLLEKELKTTQGSIDWRGIISRSKELRVLQYTLEEVSKLRNEVELLGDQKTQVFLE